MATLTVQTGTSAGVALTFNTAAAGGDEVPNTDGTTVLLLRNGHATNPRTITIATPETRDSNLAVADRAITVAALTTTVVTDLNPTHYTKSTTGRMALTNTDSAADITVACFKP